MDLQEVISLTEPAPICRREIQVLSNDEIVCIDNLMDEERNLYILASKGLKQNEWRWPPAPIDEWMLGKDHLNLKGVIRPAVFEDIRDFFHTTNSPWERDYDEAVFCEGIGSGKTQAPATTVLMYDGRIKTYVDIIVGDLVMGDDSGPRKVLEVHYVYSDAYEIIPVKGESHVVKHDHVLSLKRTNLGLINKHRKSGGTSDSQSGEIVNIEVDEYLKKSKKFKSLHKLYRVPVEFKYQDVTLDPYILGIWLGDGNSNSFSITNMDKPVIDEFYKFAYKQGYVVSIINNHGSRASRYNLTRGNNREFASKILEREGVLNNKHVPLIYKVNSRKIRMEILAGLIDADGHVDLKKNGVEFSSKRKVLADDVAYLSRSLGYAAYVTKRKTTCQTGTFESYRVSISGMGSEMPFRKRKLPDRKQKKDVLVTGIKEVKYVGKKELIGFSVDKNHLFIQGDFTVTHNSFKISIIATFFEHLLLCMKSPQRYFGIDKSSKIAVMNMSLSEKNAKKVIFSEIANKIYECKWFQQRPWIRADARVPDPNCLSELRFKNNTFIIPGSSSWRTAVGYNILVGIMDEAGGYRSTDNTDQAEDIYHTLDRRIGSRFGNKGALIIAGSPMYESDFLEKKVREGELGAKNVFARRRNLWDVMFFDWSGDFFYVDRINRILLSEKPADMKDVDKIPAVPFLFKAFRANVTKAYRDFGARPSETINAFFEYPRILMERVNPARTEDPLHKNGTFKEWFKPKDEYAFHAVHVDLALTGDACGLCIGHYAGLNAEGGIKIYIDLMMRLKGSKDAPIQISGVRDYIYILSRMGFNIQLITFDGFQSSDSIQILEKKGYRAELLSVDRTILPYWNLKEALNENRLDYYCSSPKDSTLELRLKEQNDELSPSEVFLKECMHLESIQAKKIDHSPRGSKDVADAVCGVVHDIVTNSDYFGVMQVKVL